MSDDVKIITVVFDDDGLVVDYSGLSCYEAWALLYWATDLVEGHLGSNDEDVETDES